jgi:hypothetical protein
VDGGRVYTVGAGGRFHCLDAAGGTVLWENDFPAAFNYAPPN